MSEQTRCKIISFSAIVLGDCAFIAIIWYTTYLNALPGYLIHTSDGNYDTPATEDYCLWGMLYKMDGPIFGAYVAMYALLFCAIMIIVERWLTYYFAERQTKAFTDKMVVAFANHRIEEARNLAADYPKSPLAVIINTSLHPMGVCETDGKAPSMEAWHHAMMVKSAELRQGLWHLSAASWTIPLLGLFILVIGIVHTLHVWMYAEGRPDVITSFYIIRHIADALWATVFSLVFGIPALWFHKYFRAKCERLLSDMERRSLAMLSLVARLPETIQARKALRPYDTQPLDLRVTQALSQNQRIPNYK
jgi:biopolymer transport protein ExbB/TolQ